MAWVIGIGLLVFLCVRFPHFWKFILGLIFLLVIAISSYAFKTNSDEKRAKALIRPEQITLSNLSLSQNSFHEITGEIKNNSSYTLTGLSLDVKVYDCPSLVIDKECIVIGEDKDVSPSVNVPSGQLRTLGSSYVSLYDMPQVKGFFVWNYSVSEITGK